jgi:regulator of protease activity HflC (stomatin/prohibitin superfamily)
MSDKIPRIAIIAFVAILLVVFFSTRIFVKIDAGERGVMYSLFSGLKVDKVYEQGLKMIAPWNKMYIYNVRIQEDKSIMEVLSKNGLTIRTELSYRYSPVENEIGYLHNEIGMNYLESILIPEIRSATREVIGKYLPEELYSTKREAIQDEIFMLTAERVKEKHIVLDAVLIREVVLPTKLQESIERKLQQEQMSLEYEFRLQQAAKEAERQKIEAEGKARANDILSASLTDKILKEKGIQATLELAKSQNSKVIVIGGEDGLPIILGNQ